MSDRPMGKKEDTYTEVGGDGIELGERDPSGGSFVRRLRWGYLEVSRGGVIWRKSTVWARRVAAVVH